MKGTYTYEYPRPAVTADIAIFTPDMSEVLLIRRGNEPYKDCWALPGGFMDMDETLEQCAIRELKEETNIAADCLWEVGAFSKVDRDPRGRTITVAYYGFADKSTSIKALDDAADIAWHKLSELPPLAFDHHEVLEKALEKAKCNKNLTVNSK